MVTKPDRPIRTHYSIRKILDLWGRMRWEFHSKFNPHFNGIKLFTDLLSPLPFWYDVASEFPCQGDHARSLTMLVLSVTLSILKLPQNHLFHCCDESYTKAMMRKILSKIVKKKKLLRCCKEYGNLTPLT